MFCWRYILTFAQVVANLPADETANTAMKLALAAITGKNLNS